MANVEMVIDFTSQEIRAKIKAYNFELDELEKRLVHAVAREKREAKS